MESKLSAEILDRCLQRIQRNESALAECLREVPDLADELRPLLLAAGLAHQHLAPEGPSQAFRTRAWTTLVGAARAKAPPRRIQAVPWARLSWRPATALASLLIALALVAGSVGVAYASEQALPGDSLYGVKRGLERAALALSGDDAGDTRLLLGFADRRLGEAEELLRRGRPADVDEALEGYEDAIGDLIGLAGQEGQLDELEGALATHQVRLQLVLEQAPEQAIPGLNRALERSQHGIDTVEELREGGPPDDLAPGQLKKTPGAGTPTPRIPPGKLKKTGTPEA